MEYVLSLFFFVLERVFASALQSSFFILNFWVDVTSLELSVSTFTRNKSKASLGNESYVSEMTPSSVQDSWLIQLKYVKQLIGDVAVKILEIFSVF